MNRKNILLSFLAFLTVCVTYYIAVTYFYPDIAQRGQFGDMFGGLNAIFSGVAFLGVIYAIFLQKKELSLQREELRLTREELKRAAEAQVKSELALSKQAASLEITAKLNGLSSVLHHHNTLMGSANSAKYGLDMLTFGTHKKNAEEVVKEIKLLIEKS